MLKIKFPVVSVADIDALLPDGYLLEDARGGLYFILAKEEVPDETVLVGVCNFDSGEVTLKFYDDNESAKLFTHLFGKKNPEFNPKKAIQGFVLEMEDGKFQLDTLPLVERGKAMGEIIKKVAAGKAFFVTYLWGEKWNTKMKVLSMHKFMIDGQLDNDLGEKTLDLVS